MKGESCMIYLVLAIASSAAVALLMRLSGKYSKHATAMLASNYVVCCLLAALFTSFEGITLQTEGMPMALGLGALNGVFYLAGFVLLKWNIQRNGVVLPATFQKLGVLVPTFVSIAVFHEALQPVQGVGIAAAVAAIILLQGKSDAKQAGSIWGLIALLFGGGMGDAMSKIYEEIGPAPLNDQFLLFTFISALILCVLLCVVRKEKPDRWDALFGALIAVPNYFSARFLLLSLGEVPAVVAFPSFSAGTIIAVAVAGVLFFKEKLSRRKLIALGLVLAALVLLNLKTA